MLNKGHQKEMNDNSVTITDLVGKVVYQETLIKHQPIMALANLQSGNYLLRIKNGDQMTTKRILKQ